MVKDTRRKQTSKNILKNLHIKNCLVEDFISRCFLISCFGLRGKDPFFNAKDRILRVYTKMNINRSTHERPIFDDEPK